MQPMQIINGGYWLLLFRIPRVGKEQDDDQDEDEGPGSEHGLLRHQGLR